jgi:hypothetical protein
MPKRSEEEPARFRMEYPKPRLEVIEDTLRGEKDQSFRVSITAYLPAGTSTTLSVRIGRKKLVRFARAIRNELERFEDRE